MARGNLKPIPPLTPEDIHRFWSKVDTRAGQGPNGDCWTWVAKRDHYTYGVMSLANQGFLATRVAFVIQHGSDLGDRLACHTCDNPPCVRGSHLFAGTDLENKADSIRKGRHSWGRGEAHGMRRYPPRGEKNSQAHLTAEQVLEIRSKHANGQTQRSIAIEYGQSAPTINLIVHRKNWKHI